MTNPFYPILEHEEFRVRPLRNALVIESGLIRIGRFFVYPLHLPKGCHHLGKHIFGAYVVLREKAYLQNRGEVWWMGNERVQIATWEMLCAEKYLCYRTCRGYFHTLKEAVLGMSV